MDKLADGKDIENFEKIQKDVIKKSFDDGSVHEIEQRILNLRILIFSPEMICYYLHLPNKNVNKQTYFCDKKCRIRRFRIRCSIS